LRMDHYSEERLLHSPQPLPQVVAEYQHEQGDSNAKLHDRK
jgi:hypothetical protein